MELLLPQAAFDAGTGPTGSVCSSLWGQRCVVFERLPAVLAKELSVNQAVMLPGASLGALLGDLAEGLFKVCYKRPALDPHAACENPPQSTVWR